MDYRPELELIVSTVAVLLVPRDLSIPHDINPDELTTILRKPLNISQMPGGLTIIISNRDQVEVQLFANKIDVRDSSGDVAQAGKTIPRVIRKFCDTVLTGETIITYGINFIVEFDREGPKEWLGQNLLKDSLVNKLGGSPSSNLIQVNLDRPPKTLSVSLEVRPNEKLSINFNASQPSNSLPSDGELARELQEQYEVLKDLVAKIGS